MVQRTASSSLGSVPCSLDPALVAVYLDRRVFHLKDRLASWLQPMNLAFQMY